MLKLIAAAITAAALITLPTLASAQTATPAAKTEKTTNAKPKAEKPLSPAQAAMRDRQKKCGAEWKTAKAAGKIQKGQTWPQYWSACNKRLKGA
jgi:hypothetical protein